MRLPHLAVLIVLSVIWGSAFTLVKVVLEDVGPLTLVAGRLTVAAIFLAAAVAVTGRSLPRTRGALGAFVFLGLVNNVLPFTFLTWGQQHIDSSVAAILVASMPLSTILLAHYWIGESLTADRVLGILVGFGGVFLLLGADLRDITETSTLGQLAVIIGTLGYAAGTVFARRHLQQMDGMTLASGQTLVGAAFIVPVALAVERPFDLSISVKTGVAWATLGLVSSAVAYLLFFWVLRRTSATQASMVSYLIPVTAVFLGVLILDERLAATAIAGLALIIAGVWVVNGGGEWMLRRIRGEGETVEVTPAGGGGEDGSPQ